MPRTARASVGGVCYHVLNRGNNRETVFHDADDYEAFLELIALANARRPMRVLAFALMPNHFHLLLWLPFKSSAKRLGLESSVHPRERPKKK